MESQTALDDFTERWERGEVTSVEDYLAGLGEAAPPLAIELVYREYCLAELAGRNPDPAAFLARFPELRSRLERLFALHGNLPSSRLESWFGGATAGDPFPEAGDEIGPYFLRRELGRGSFARVFLAEQSDLENRQVVVKVSTRPTREPWLLARARHGNIVEILTHAIVDDGAFQLIAMPFLGGATLSEVLRHRRQIGRARGSRGDLLKDLDAVAAPEYEEVKASHPARELMASLTDACAMAWVAARLAEALDHAFGRDVAHGDIKPSNILLTANGTPMLLDFNLAQDWSPRESAGPVAGPGGTLAYMAPERLRAIASVACPARHSGLDPPQSTADGDAGAAAPHSADIYSLGMVLLEALTGSLLLPRSSARGRALREQPSFHEAAAEYASFRERGAEAVIRAAESAALRPIPPALRAILARCLAAEPTARYRRARELAEDLDRWRSDRPLAYAKEPFWSQSLPRWWRRNKKPMAAAGLVAMTMALSSYIVVAKSNYESRTESQSREKLARLWDDVESRALQFQRPGSRRLQDPDDPDVLAVALHALKEYDVLGDPGWRLREDIRSLPADDRVDLEFWLMEQAYRYCRALESRPGSPGDWLRAMATLDRVNTSPPLGALEDLRDRLRARLEGTGAFDSLARGPWPTRPVAAGAADSTGSQGSRDSCG